LVVLGQRGFFVYNRYKYNRGKLFKYENT
jgi:hypothetical protein